MTIDHNDDPNVIGKECRFATHLPSRDYGVPDFHMVKEILHYKDGTKKPNVRLIKNFRRPFFVTKKQQRNHEQKKEYEQLDNLLRYECTQSELPRAIAKALDKGYMGNPQMRQLTDSPYLYGSDISASSIIKHDYLKKWPDAISPYSVAFFDIETDVLNVPIGQDYGDPNMATLVYADKKKVFTAVSKEFVKGYANPEERVMSSISKYLQEYIDKYSLEVEVKYVDGPVEIIKLCMEKAHEWSPDFLAIWNIDFDIPRIIATLEKYGIDPADVFSDPRLSKELRFCKYKKGSVKKVTASGKAMPKSPSQQWHTLLCPSGFYVIDAMCTYRFVRQGSQELAYYDLDFVLNEEIKRGKLKFDEANHVQKLDWHILMQSKYPFEYIAYNIFDCIGMLELETKTKDLAQAMPIQCGWSDFSGYNKQTKLFADKIHFFLLDRGKVCGTVPPRAPDAPEEPDDVISEEEMRELEEATKNDDDEDKANTRDDEESDFQAVHKEHNLRGLIVTLPAHMSVYGRSLIAESETFSTMIRTNVYDSDAVSAYPSAATVCNVSRETCVREIIEIEDIDEATYRRHNLNLLQGHVNALEYACTMHRLPVPQKALELFADMV